MPPREPLVLSKKRRWRAGGHVNRAGEQQGRLTVIRWAGNNSRGKAYWLCVCACGQQVTVRLDGGVRSCGCIGREQKRDFRQKDAAGRARFFNQLDIPLDGRFVSAAEASRLMKIKLRTIKARIERGWPLDKVLKPVPKIRRWMDGRKFRAKR